MPAKWTMDARRPGRERRRHPTDLLKPSTSVIGTGDTIRLPVDSSRVDHEAELAVVIGARPRRCGR